MSQLLKDCISVHTLTCIVSSLKPSWVASATIDALASSPANDISSTLTGPSGDCDPLLCVTNQSQALDLLTSVSLFTLGWGLRVSPIGDVTVIGGV